MSEDATLPPADPDATLPPVTSSPVSGPGRPGAMVVVPGYEILGELGRGGMGVVYMARQTGLGRLVALKMILSGAHATHEDMARFRTEAEAIARLHHPGIVQVYEIGECEGRPYFSLEFCAGGSLESKLAGTPMPPHEAAALVRALAEAMHVAHEAGVVHRDLKPANVLLTLPGEGRHGTVSGLQNQGGDLARSPGAKITDFGLAKKLDADTGQTRTGSIMGTPSYMAPEQAEGKKEVGPAADIYALGAILYECLTGRPPFRAANVFDTILQVIGQEPVPPRLLQPAIPRDLETIVLQCLEKKPEKRYATAAVLAADLGHYLADEPITARRPGLVERGLRWARKQGRQVVLLGGVGIAVAVLTLIVVLGLAAWQEARKGSLELQTEGPTLTAELFHDGRAELVQRFRVPTADPVRLDPGVYRARLSAPGMIDQQARVLITPGGMHQFQVDLAEQEAWSAITFGPVRLGHPNPRSGSLSLRTPPLPLALHDRTDLILVETTGIRRVDGRTGKVSSFPVQNTNSIRFPEKFADVDGDGVADLVLQTTNPAQVEAFSGADGRSLFQSKSPGSGEGLIGYLSAEGRTRDVLALSFPGDYSKPARLDRVSGKGKVVWTSSVDVGFWRPNNAIPETHSGLWRGQQALFLVSGPRVLVLDPRTGKRIAGPLGVGVQSEAVRLHDIDGDGNLDLVWTAGPNSREWAGTVQAFSAAGDRQLWTRQGDVRLGGVISGKRDIADPLLLTLGMAAAGNGWLAVERLNGATGELRWQARVVKNLPTPVGRGITCKIIVGPDLDQDGAPDLFAVSTSEVVFGNYRKLLHIHALSGADGRTLWYQQQTALEALHEVELCFWPGGPAGLPRLVVNEVPYEYLNEKPRIRIFDVRNGERLHELMAATSPRVVELESEGSPALVYMQVATSTDIREFRIESRSESGVVQNQPVFHLRAVRGTLPTAWRWLGQWEALADLDGDGTIDVLRRELDGTLAAASGATGELFWPGGRPIPPRPLPAATRGPARRVADGSVLAIQSPGTVAELLVLDSKRIISSSQALGQIHVPLRSLAPEDGTTRWTAVPFTMNAFVGSNTNTRDYLRPTQPTWLDLPDRPLILERVQAAVRPSATDMANRLDTWLALFDARTGAALWNQKTHSEERRWLGPSRDDAPPQAVLAGSAENPRVVVLDMHRNPRGIRFWFHAIDPRSTNAALSIDLGDAVVLDMQPVAPRMSSLPLPGGHSAVVFRAGQQVRALDAETGKQQWNFTDVAFESGLVRGPGGPAVWQTGRDAPALVAFSTVAFHPATLVMCDASGREIQRRPFVHSTPPTVQSWGPGAKADRLLVVDGNRIWSARAGIAKADELWSWSAPENAKDLQLVEVVPVGEADGLVILRSQTLQRLYALHVADGVLHYRVREASSAGMSVSFLPTTDLQQAECLVSQPGRSTAWQTIPRVSEQGKEFPLRLPALTFVPAENDPRTVMPLLSALKSIESGFFWATQALGLLLSLVVLIIPARLLGKAFARRSFRLFLLSFAWWATVLGGVYLVGGEVQFYFIGRSSDAIEMWLLTALLAIGLFPMAILLWALLDGARRRSRGKLLGLFVLWLVSCAVFAGAMLWFASYYMDPEQHFGTEGWERVWLPGLYTAGVLYLLGIPLRGIVRWWRRKPATAKGAVA